MSGETLAMFPLGTVLLPGAPLSLHVFEPRYQALVRDCRASGEFGVVLIERGNEVGGGDVRTAVGTVARIHDVVDLPHGRCGLLAVGGERLRVREWLADDPYPRAVVERWPDEDDSAIASDTLDAAGAMRRVFEVGAEAGWEVGQAVAALDTIDRLAPSDASFALSGIAPVGPADRQRLLACPGPRRRLGLLVELLDDAEAVLHFRLQPGG